MVMTLEAAVTVTLSVTLSVSVLPPVSSSSPSVVATSVAAQQIPDSVVYVGDVRDNGRVRRDTGVRGRTSDTRERRRLSERHQHD